MRLGEPLPPSASRRTQDADGRASNRRGFTLAELAIATLMLVLAMSATVRSFGWMLAQRREVQHRELALQEASNVLERVTALGWSDLTSDRAAACSLSEAARHRLPGATLKVALEAQQDPQPAKRIRVEVGWRDRSGALQPPIRLVSWVYRHQGGEP